MNEYEYLVRFNIDEQSYALHLSAVTRVIRAVEITALPKAPEIVTGVINMHGEIIPAVNVRKRFRLPEREVDCSDRIIIARTSRRQVALVVDSVEGVIEYPNKKILPPEKISPGIEYIEGVVKLDDGMVLVHDLEKFLSLEEEKELDATLKETGEIP